MPQTNARKRAPPSEHAARKKHKQRYGQFFTTHAEYILQGMSIPEDQSVVEPFCGNGDLVRWGAGTDAAWECFDIDPRHESIIQRDTLQDPPTYEGKYVVSNPPFLALNKMKNAVVKELCQRLGTNDLFKCFLRTLIDSPPCGGIVIVPVNFWSSVRTMDLTLRRDFCTTFSVRRLNIFEVPVFDDTSCAICAFQFERRTPSSPLTIPVWMYPSGTHMSLEMGPSTNFTIGHRFRSLRGDDNIRIKRVLRGDAAPNTQFTLRALDSNSNGGPDRIALMLRSTPHFGKHSDRTFASIDVDCTPPLTIGEQEAVATTFNQLLNDERTRCHSLFLPTYREGTRKRMPFGMAWTLVRHSIGKIREKNL